VGEELGAIGLNGAAAEERRHLGEKTILEEYVKDRKYNQQ
jgi:hypothetical protein